MDSKSKYAVLEKLWAKVEFAKDIEFQMVEDGHILEANEIAFFTDRFYPGDVVKEIYDDGEARFIDIVLPTPGMLSDYYFRMDIEADIYFFTGVEHEESKEMIDEMISFLEEKGYVYQEPVKATNVKQISIDIAAPADWDGESFITNLLEEAGLLVFGTNQIDLTFAYEREKDADGHFGIFSLNRSFEKKEEVKEALDAKLLKKKGQLKKSQREAKRHLINITERE